MPRYKAVLEYDGTGFVGWQRQDNGPSVQAALEAAIRGFCAEEVVATAAGRTDAGVHALGQVVHFDLAREVRETTVRDALNDHLRRAAGGPCRIAVLAAHQVSDDFHARFSATARQYRYRIVNRVAPLALDHGRALRVLAPLDTDAMQAAAQRLVGRHDFTTFRSVRCQSHSPVKTLDSLTVARDGCTVTVEARARSFLHGQVRAMAGTLVQVGRGQRTGDDIVRALAARDRACGGPTAPACGLYLVEVRYDERGSGF